jgi:hypothetical protein
MFPVGVQICPTAEVIPKLETMAAQSSPIRMGVGCLFIGKSNAEEMSLVVGIGV